MKAPPAVSLSFGLYYMLNVSYILPIDFVLSFLFLFFLLVLFGFWTRFCVCVKSLINIKFFPTYAHISQIIFLFTKRLIYLTVTF